MSVVAVTPRAMRIGRLTSTRLSIQAVGPMPRPPYEKGMSNRRRFQAFHAANPQVYDALKALAFNDYHAGVKHVNIAASCELLRYSSIKAQDPNGEYSDNNTYRAYYARTLVADHPEPASMFELRK